MDTEDKEVSAGLRACEWCDNRGEGTFDCARPGEAPRCKEAAPAPRYKTDISVRQQADPYEFYEILHMGGEERIQVRDEEDTQGMGGRASEKQIGGNHYKNMEVQPTEFITKNDLGWCEGNAVKYICRHHLKGGEADLDKAIHYLELLKEMIYK